MPKKNTASSATTIPSSATTVPSSATTVPSFATTIPSFATIAASSATTVPSSATIVPSSATTVPSSATTGPSSATTVSSFATTVPSSATTVPSSATIVPSSAITVPSSAITTASSSWSIIQSPPSTLTPIVDRWPGNLLNLNDRPASYIETMRYLESENSRLKREVQTTQETFTREISNIEAVLSYKLKLLDEADTERVTLELNIKRLRDDNEDLKNKLEKKTKNLQMAEQNAMIHEKHYSDLQWRAKCKKLTEKQSDRSKALLDALKHQEKEQIDFINVVISRVLCISWTRPIKGSIFLPQMAAYIQTQRQLDFSDIIRQALMEVLCMFSNREAPFYAPSPYQFSLTLLVEYNILSEPKSFNYLLDCYSRVAIEEKNYGKQSSVPPLSDVLTILKAQCVQYSSLVLQGLIGICEAAVIPMCTTHFGNLILLQSLPRGYLREFVATIYTNLDTFNKIFTSVLQKLYLALDKANVLHRKAIEVLSELIDIRCGPNGNIHPICHLITNQIQFLPDVMTSAAGIELTRISFFGQFLSVLICAEVQPKLAEKLFSETVCFTMNTPYLILQEKLENIRMSLHKMFDAIFANSSCRDAILAYLAALLRHNKKRMQIQTEDNPSLAGDGFMLNLLSILQMLSAKIKLDTVDPLYPFHPSSFIEIKNDTRLKLTSQEVAEWQKHLANTHKWRQPKFPTQCWFLTLHCHHIALLSALQNYRRKLRASKDLQEMLDELQATEPQWKDSPLAEHNKDLIKQWKQQLKQLVKSKLYAEAGLIDPIFWRRYSDFYISVAEFLLSLLTQTAPGNPLPELPLPQEVTCKFTALPE